jgi:hypothetical protein
MQKLAALKIILILSTFGQLFGHFSLCAARRFGQMSVMVIHSYRNRSQNKTIFDLRS